jgi:hypothetical protein
MSPQCRGAGGDRTHLRCCPIDLAQVDAVEPVEQIAVERRQSSEEVGEPADHVLRQGIAGAVVRLDEDAEHCRQVVGAPFLVDLLQGCATFDWSGSPADAEQATTSTPNADKIASNAMISPPDLMLDCTLFAGPVESRVGATSPRHCPGRLLRRGGRSCRWRSGARRRRRTGRRWLSYGPRSSFGRQNGNPVFRRGHLASR